MQLTLASMSLEVSTTVSGFDVPAATSSAPCEKLSEFRQPRPPAGAELLPQGQAVASEPSPGQKKV
jgi:hypothetical protein